MTALLVNERACERKSMYTQVNDPAD